MAKPVPTPIVPNVPASSLGQIIREPFAQGMQTHYVPWHNFIGFRESSFNMTRGGDEDIETRSLKF